MCERLASPAAAGHWFRTDSLIGPLRGYKILPEDETKRNQGKANRERETEREGTKMERSESGEWVRPFLFLGCRRVIMEGPILPRYYGYLEMHPGVVMHPTLAVKARPNLGPKAWCHAVPVHHQPLWCNLDRWAGRISTRGRRARRFAPPLGINTMDIIRKEGTNTETQ